MVQDIGIVLLLVVLITKARLSLFMRGKGQTFEKYKALRLGVEFN